jgi:hypothetical protein
MSWWRAWVAENCSADWLDETAPQLQRKQMKSHWPLVGLLVAACLFVVAASQYPGGTTWSGDSIGYDWTRNFISSLFAPTALNGSPNRARYIAIPAMLALSLSLAVVFKRISMRPNSKAFRRTIEIAGIGSQVYAFLVVTPMHNLMVTISLVFYLVAMLAILAVLYVGRERRLLVAGLACLSLLLFAAISYYGNVMYQLLPVMQKLSFIACTAWLFTLYYSSFHTAAASSTVPGATVSDVS